MAGKHRPIRPAFFSDKEVAGLFLPLENYGRLTLAVSGGPDSMALMLLAARWSRLRGRKTPPISVLTVDHGLRPESPAEAEFVAKAAKRIGFTHTTLHWSEPKPASGIQAAAREARYRLMTAFAIANGIEAIVTAHHRDDQIETLLMRLARGSGLSGLAAMAVVTHRNGIAIVRPLLGVPKARLKAYLQACGETWIEDPSNENAAYERTRIRHLLSMLHKSGFSASALALSVQRLARARAAIEAAAAKLAREAIAVDQAGFAIADLRPLLSASDEVLIALLEKALAGLGGGARPVRLAKIEALVQALRAAAPPRQYTLGGCLMRLRQHQLLFFREAGRMGSPELTLNPGETALWDGRFRLSAPAAAPGPLRVAALGAAGIKQFKAKHGQTLAIPKAAAETGPCFWLGSNLIAAPQLGAFGAPLADASSWALGLRAAFLNPFNEGGNVRIPDV